jgi:hypothetical protein
MALQNMPVSRSKRRCEPAMPEFETKEGLPPLSNATVNLSVDWHFPVGARPVLPLSGTRLLTIEWE